MQDIITIRLPKKLKTELEKITKAEKISKSDLIRDAITRYLSVIQFRSIRKKVLPYFEKKGILTDEDVFNILK